MSIGNFGRLALAIGLAVGLTGCVEGTSPFGGGAKATDAGSEAAATARPSALTLVERDVEAPEVFRLNEEGLWDGRPSLGGVWVAHSTVKDPERVIIRNPKTGKSVIGALFRREAENPGPSLQISSDAAGALEILAGAPTTVEVVALRREEPEEPVPVEDEALVADGEAPATTEPAADEAAAPATPDMIAATAAAALDKAEGIAPATVETGVDGAPLEPAPVTDAPKKRRGLFGGLFGRKNAPIASPTTALPDATSPDEATAAAPADTAPGVVETSVLPATPASAAVLQRAYVQIGIFSTAENAQRAADQMKAAGMTATVKQDASQGKAFWRVIVGPAASVAERDALAGRVKGIGYPDAYPVKQ